MNKSPFTRCYRHKRANNKLKQKTLCLLFVHLNAFNHTNQHALISQEVKIKIVKRLKLQYSVFFAQNLWFSEKWKLVFFKHSMNREFEYIQTSELIEIIKKYYLPLAQTNNINFNNNNNITLSLKSASKPASALEL